MEVKAEKLLIVGGGETAELAYEYFTCDTPYEVVGFTVEKAYLHSDRLFGLPVVPFEEVEQVYHPSNFKAFVAVSYTQLNRIRTRLYLEAKRKGYKLASYVSPKAFIWRNVAIGENCFILESNVLQYSVEIGNNVVLWSGNHLGHRSTIKDNCFVSSHVVISGYCEVGENCFLGVNSCPADHIKVAKDCVIAAGTVVLKDTEERKIYRGNPAVPAQADSFRLFRVKERKEG
jgi:sugar O-acyltransferase (sialic acid O-acetyltransferase NeuD family)